MYVCDGFISLSAEEWDVREASVCVIALCVPHWPWIMMADTTHGASRDFANYGWHDSNKGFELGYLCHYLAVPIHHMQLCDLPA